MSTGGVITGGSGASVLVAEAKLTLSLRVTGVRPDGYHLLRSEMVTVDLADRLEVSAGSGLTVANEFGAPAAAPSSARGGAPGLATAWPGPGAPDPLGAGADNLVSQALAVAGRTARVHLVKRVPPGAGLGGGSADAAAILRWAGCTEPGVAARLGADVPFCLEGGRALVGGIGEQVTPLPFVDRSFVLVLLPFGVETAAVYRAWDELAARGAVGPAAPAAPGDGDGPGPEVNDLETPAEVVEPRLAVWRQRLSDLTGHQPKLAGSGSTWFFEGTPEGLGLGARGRLTFEGEEALVVPVRTTRGAAG